MALCCAQLGVKILISEQVYGIQRPGDSFAMPLSLAAINQIPQNSRSPLRSKTAERFEILICFADQERPGSDYCSLRSFREGDFLFAVPKQLVEELLPDYCLQYDRLNARSSVVA